MSILNDFMGYLSNPYYFGGLSPSNTSASEFSQLDQAQPLVPQANPPQPQASVPMPPMRPQGLTGGYGAVPLPPIRPSNLGAYTAAVAPSGGLGAAPAPLAMNTDGPEAAGAFWRQQAGYGQPTDPMPVASIPQAPMASQGPSNGIESFVDRLKANANKANYHIMGPNSILGQLQNAFSPSQPIQQGAGPLTILFKSLFNS